ncbi:MAG TPA: IS4/IS5 family transposase, partial [Phycisphaerales bacterium]|nr:IS4/IS5 family transposase [Phycisphaerales bacterium]
VLRGRDADPFGGGPQVAQAHRRRCGRSRRERVGVVQGPEAFQRDAPVRGGPRCPADEQGRRGPPAPLAAHADRCVERDVRVDTADGRAERRNALAMLDHVRGRHGLVPRVVAADAGYGAGEFLCALEARGITPHAALAKGKIAGDSEPHRARRRMRRRMRTAGYRMSQKLRRMIEPVIGWCKQTGGLGRTRFIGHERIQNDGLIVAAAWNLIRMVTLSGET